MTYDELIGSADKNGYIPCDVWKEWDESYSVFDVIVRYKDGRSELYSDVKGLVTAKINLTIKYHDKSQNTRIKLEDIFGIDMRNYRLIYPNRDDLHDKEQMLFDWDKAARIVKYADKYFKNDPKFWIEVTVDGDDGCASGTIYKNGKPNYSAVFTYLASAEFKPMIVLHIDNGSWRSNREALIKLQMVFDLAMDFDDPDPINTRFTAPCYKMQHEVPDWNASTWWPESARAIFNS